MNLRNITIKLEGSNPVINRKLIVPDDMNLSEFHHLIQRAMSWQNIHFYQFKIPGYRWTEEPNKGAIGSKMEQNLIAKDWSIARLIETTGTKNITYTYNFGDDWEHKISIGSIVKPQPRGFYPKLVEANGVCPPENCGGINGYYHLLKVLNDPNHLDHNDIKEWINELGRDFNPNEDVFPRLEMMVTSFACQRMLPQKSPKKPAKRKKQKIWTRNY